MSVLGRCARCLLLILIQSRRWRCACIALPVRKSKTRRSCHTNPGWAGRAPLSAVVDPASPASRQWAVTNLVEGVGSAHLVAERADQIGIILAEDSQVR